MKETCIGITALLLAFVFTGCFVMGTNKNYHPFDSEALANVTPGLTTAREILDLFGAPTELVEMSNGNAYVYHRSVAKGTVVWLLLVSFGNYDKQYDQLVFFFDDNDILTHYGISLHAHTAAYGFPF